MAKHLFVQKVAGLEGHRGIEIAKGFFEVTLENIDTRLINLEKSYNIASPPPMLDVTWESLEFRARRLEGYLPPRRIIIDQDEEQTMESSVTPQTVRKVLIRLDPKLVLTREPETPKKTQKTDKLGEDVKEDGADGDEDFDFALETQNLWFAAGKKSWQFTDLIKNLDQLYHATVDLTIQLEKPGAPPMMPPPAIAPGVRPGPPMHPRMPMPPSPPRWFGGKPKKGCCGCVRCSCFCHGPQVIKVRHKKRITGGFFRFGWLKNLFSRKKKLDYDSDTSSVTSSSGSSTAV